MFQFYRRYEELCARLRDLAITERGRARLERERSDWRELAFAAGMHERIDDTMLRLRLMQAPTPDRSER
jgi:hypothetical protein